MILRWHSSKGHGCLFVFFLCSGFVVLKVSCFFAGDRDTPFAVMEKGCPPAVRENAIQSTDVSSGDKENYPCDKIAAMSEEVLTEAIWLGRYEKVTIATRQEISRG